MVKKNSQTLICLPNVTWFRTNNCLTPIPPERFAPKGHVWLDIHSCLHNLPPTTKECNSAHTAVSVKSEFLSLRLVLCSWVTALTLLAFEPSASYSSCRLCIIATKTMKLGPNACKTVTALRSLTLATDVGVVRRRANKHQLSILINVGCLEEGVWRAKPTQTLASSLNSN